MKISLKSLIDTDKDYYIKDAIYSKKLNKLKLIIVGKKEKEIEEKLEKYFSYVNLALKYEDIKEKEEKTNPIEEFYENQPLPDFYETGYENQVEEIVENKNDQAIENKENKDIFDLPNTENKKDENTKEEKTSSLRDLKKIELENMIQNARNNKKESDKKEKDPSEILKYGRNITEFLYREKVLCRKKRYRKMEMPL